MVSNERVFAILTLCGIIGLIFALILQFLYEGGILVDELVSGTITLRELQLGVIVLWEVFGIIVAAAEA